MLRALTEKLARGRTLRRHIRIAGRRWPIYVSPDAQLKYLKPGSRSFDRDLIEIARQELRADSSVWDIGANVGTFTVASAAVATGGNVVAIEADIWLAGLLQKTSDERCYGDRIQVLPCAIADECGTNLLRIAKRGRASNSLSHVPGATTMGGVRELRLVPTLSCDRLLSTLPKPDFVKIDVEGAELLVLKGARTLLRDVRPVIYVEINSAVASQVADLMAEADYSLVNPVADRILPTNSLFRPNG